MENYIIVTWPEIQKYMEYSDFEDHSTIIIEDSNANPDIVIEELIENFGYKGEYEKDA